MLQLMISKLAPWVWRGAWALAFIAGMINVVGLLGFEHQAVTHLTGTTSMLAAAVTHAQTDMAFRLVCILLAFMAGAALSGAIIGDSALQLGRRYGVTLLLESILLILAVPLLNRGSAIGMYLASCACGLQNAMASTYSGSVVRTTHLSGMFTDLGIYLGHLTRGRPVEGRRLRLCGVVIAGFFCGGIAGTLSFHRLKYASLYIPAGLTGFTALSYGLYTLRHTLRKHSR